MKRPQKSSLSIELDAFALALIKEANASKIGTTEGEDDADGSEAGGVEFRDRVGLFTALTRYLQVKHRIDPDDNPDQWSKEVGRFHGRASGGKGRPRKDNADPAGDGDAGAISPIPINAFRPQR